MKKMGRMLSGRAAPTQQPAVEPAARAPAPQQEATRGGQARLSAYVCARALKRPEVRPTPARRRQPPLLLALAALLHSLRHAAVRHPFSAA